MSVSAMQCVCSTGFTIQPLERPSWVTLAVGGGTNSLRLQASETASTAEELAKSTRMPGQT